MRVFKLNINKKTPITYIIKTLNQMQNIQDKHEQTPLQITYTNKNYNIVNLIRNHSKWIHV